MIVFAVLIIYNLNKPVVIPPPPALPSCDELDTDQLPKLDSKNTCPSGDYFYGNFIVSDLKIAPENVCAPYCDNIESSVCKSTDTSQVSNFNTCVSSLKKSTCTGPIPVAIYSGVLQYPLTIKGVNC